MQIGYLGPEGTFSDEALRDALARGAPLEGVEGAVERVALPTIYDAVLAVQEERVEWALVPIENSLEGSVDVTLDALAVDAVDVRIVGELVHPVHHCLIARAAVEPDQLTRVLSHPQVIGQCARFLRGLPAVSVVTASSTAEAVRQVAEHEHEPWGALGNRLAAELYSCRVLREGVEDHPDNETRFVWLSRETGKLPGDADQRPGGACKTSLVFWGRGAQAAGWLVDCLSELASRSVNLTRIESRPRGPELGRYMFFADLEGHEHETHVAEAIEGLRGHCDELRVLGSYPVTER
ncbi:MAG TPA: prephenate dehydratase [Solirubrobacteraceae bacterium]|nr:prephenate dehydratase [Solirubrobacteraceae bacterium]